MKRRFLMAVIIGTWFAVIRWDSPRTRFWGFVRLLYFRWKMPPASNLKYRARMDSCRKCPVFYAPLRTCGSPLDKERGKLGCHCSLEVKNRIEVATCWLHDKGVTSSGWSSNL